jgi:hypothetical protein
MKRLIWHFFGIPKKCPRGFFRFGIYLTYPLLKQAKILPRGIQRIPGTRVPEISKKFQGAEIPEGAIILA